MSVWPDPVVALLDAQRVLHLALADQGGVHSAPLFYARVARGLVWASAPASRHSMAREVAASVSPSAPALDAIEGLQIRGRVRLEPNLRGAYLRRYPSVEPQLEGHLLYLLEPHWLRLVRGRRRWEWRAGPGGRLFVA